MTTTIGTTRSGVKRMLVGGVSWTAAILSLSVLLLVASYAASLMSYSRQGGIARQPLPRQPAPAQEWIRLPNEANFTQDFLAALARNGTEPCHSHETAGARLQGLPAPARLPCGGVHELLLVSYDERGRRRCHGGDYYEAELWAGQPLWRSRAPIRDKGDGSYALLLQVPPSRAGVFTLRVVLLASNFHALHDRVFRNKVVVDLRIEFQAERGAADPPLRQCEAARDFQLDAWAGRWTRATSRASPNCTADDRGRFVCIRRRQACEGRWCRGPLGALESNGLAYSAHCAFRLFDADAAWRCLDRKWLFFWGDSNHVDSIRNLLTFVLGLPHTSQQVQLPRRFDATFVRPSPGPRHSFRITSMFNGHSNASLNYQGLFSLHDPAFREQIGTFFVEGFPGPDVVILNSGIHDGIQWKRTSDFLEVGLREAIKLWHSLINRVQRRPRLIYRTTIDPAGWARTSQVNPYKMEVFNHMFVEQLRRANLLWGVVDNFDITYPWHFDNNCSDGWHYGKPPLAKWWYGNKGRQYFVDLMLIHILLHAICS